MKILKKLLPDNISFLLILLFIYFFISLVYRAVFLVFFKPGDIPVFSQDMLYATYLGIKFDLRLAGLIVLPLFVMACFLGRRMLEKKVFRVFILLYTIAVFAGMMVFFGFDFGSYSYIRNRVSSALFMFLDNPDISLGMIYQSYPVYSIAAGFIALLAGFALFMSKLLGRHSPSGSIKRAPAVFYILFFLAVSVLIYGRASRFPLRWSEAYFTTDGFVSNYAFNPVLYFYDSLKVKPHNYDKKKAGEAYLVLADYYGVGKNNELNLARKMKPELKFEVQPNIVVILLETFASFKVGAMGNRLNPSPNFDRLSERGMLFNNFYVPMENTSRSIFCSLFGIPDVSAGYYSSKNPLVVEQHTILNALEEYEKFYFIGGSANWGNIRGVLSYNIEGLKIFEEGSYSSPVQDVWGISDADLFCESNNILRDVKEPFFAFIQTAGNHRPFTIPADSKGFICEDMDEALLAENGFYSLKEYNGFRFLDHCLGYYFSLAEQEEYFDNTIFIIYGDHGTNGGALDRRFGDLALASYSVPLLIYSPGLIKEPAVISSIASSLDLMPTIAGLVGKEYINKAFGRDLFDESFEGRGFAFTFTPFRTPPRHGLLMDEFYVNIEPDGSYSLFYRGEDKDYRCIREEYPDAGEYMFRLGNAVYEYSRYLLYHNKRNF